MRNPGISDLSAECFALLCTYHPRRRGSFAGGSKLFVQVLAPSTRIHVLMQFYPCTDSSGGHTPTPPVHLQGHTTNSLLKVVLNRIGLNCVLEMILQVAFEGNKI